MIERIVVPRQHHEVPPEAYAYFLGVLPPVRTLVNGFVFAEGLDPWRLFFRHEGRYWVRTLTDQETRVFAEGSA